MRWSPRPTDARPSTRTPSTADLVHALEHDEFFLLYQPYIDLRTAQVVGVEALIRWDHPTLGVLEPSSFISMAERTDVIVALDTWVLASRPAARPGPGWTTACPPSGCR